MEDIINKFAVEHFGTYVFLVIVVLVGIVSLTLFLHNIYIKVKSIDGLPCNEHKNDISDIKERVFAKEDLPCATHQLKISEHGETLARLETSVEFLAKSIDAFAQEAQKAIPSNNLTQTHSPLSITDKGREKIKSLGIDIMFENNWDRIKRLIDDGVKDKNAYDIDRFCIEQSVVYPDKFLSADEILKLKNDAFKEGLTLTSYMKVIAVLSRDRYFKEIGLKIEELDTQQWKE